MDGLIPALARKMKRKSLHSTLIRNKEEDDDDADADDNNNNDMELEKG